MRHASWLALAIVLSAHPSTSPAARSPAAIEFVDGERLLGVVARRGERVGWTRSHVYRSSLREQRWRRTPDVPEMPIERIVFADDSVMLARGSSGRIYRTRYTQPWQETDDPFDRFDWTWLSGGRSRNPAVCALDDPRATMTLEVSRQNCFSHETTALRIARSPERVRLDVTRSGIVVRSGSADRAAVVALFREILAATSEPEFGADYSGTAHRFAKLSWQCSDGAVATAFFGAEVRELYRGDLDLRRAERLWLVERAAEDLPPPG